MSDKAVYDRSISNFRFICIFAMMFAHDRFGFALINCGSHPIYAETHSLISYLNYISYYGLSRISSPFLGFVSGYFASTNFRDRPYLIVLKRRLRSLYVPAVFWSIAYFAVTIAFGYATSDSAYIRRQLAAVHAGDFIGFNHSLLNFPLNYLIDILECVIIAPVLILILKRFGGWLFLLVTATGVCVLVATDLNHYQPGLNADNILPRADVFLFFSLGLLAQRSWGVGISDALERLRTSNWMALAAIGSVFLLGTLHWAWLVHLDGRLASGLGFLVLLVVRMCGSLLLLTLLPWLRRLARRGFYADDRLTFNLFCTHMISFYALNGVTGWGKGPEIYGVLLFYLAPVVATCAAAALFGSSQLFSGFAVRHSSRTGSES